MEINVVDTNDPWLVKPMIQLTEWKKIVIEIAAGPNGIARMVDAIIQRTLFSRTPDGRGSIDGHGSITVLRIYSHGNDSGEINVAAGKDENGPDLFSGISLDNLPKLSPILGRLRPYFAPNARVELLACSVAKKSEGEQLMLQLAKLWGVRVQASPNKLTVGSVNFQGPVYEANPGGGLSCAVPTELTRKDP